MMSGISSVFLIFQAEPGIGALILIEGLKGGEKDDEITSIPLTKIVCAVLKEHLTRIIYYYSFNL